MSAYRIVKNRWDAVYVDRQRLRPHVTRPVHLRFCGKLAVIATFLTLACGFVQAHDHLAAGASSSTPGAALVFENDGTFGGDSGFVFNLTKGTTNNAYAGTYYTDELVFAALAATPDYGGPEPGAAGLGAHIQAQLLGIEGPTGATFGFWETTTDGVDSTNLTWSLPIPHANATNLIAVSENDGSPGADPYGHLHGRVYSFTKPGLYRMTWRFIDTSTNGPNGQPVNAPSAPFSLYFQAGVTLGGVRLDTNSMNVTFAAPANPPDSGVGSPTTYTLEGSASLGGAAGWQPVGDSVVGDDHLHTLSIPTTSSAQFFRLRTND